MPSRIKGITIEIGANTVKLTEALRNVDSNLKDTQADLRDVNKLLKLDPGNTDLVAQKQRLLADNIIPILCIGETEAQYDAGETANVIKSQLEGSLAGLTGEEVAKMVIAYEPIWAIGTGKTATSEQAQEVCHAIRVVLAEMYGQAVADEVRIQYGGSMNGGNVKGLMAQPEIDGGLIGGASLVAAKFTAIVDAAQ